MKTRTLCLFLFIILSGCSHRIVRMDYEINKSNYRNCDIAIKKYMAIPKYVQKIGEVKLGETGFAVSCSEAHAIDLLKKEGCALKADIINIIEERKPNLWSSCYRCRAEFYIYTSPQAKMENEEFHKGNVYKPAPKSKNNNSLYALGALVIGFIAAYLLLR